MKKVDAIREFYNKGAINDETIVYSLTSFGKYGIPTIFLIFTHCALPNIKTHSHEKSIDKNSANCTNTNHLFLWR